MLPYYVLTSPFLIYRLYWYLDATVFFLTMLILMFSLYWYRDAPVLCLDDVYLAAVHGEAAAEEPNLVLDHRLRDASSIILFAWKNFEMEN